MRAADLPRGGIATPHHLASRAGRDVLADGGNAADAIVAAGLVLAVVTPYHCGLGGDLVALVHDGRPHGLLSIGAAPAGASVAAVRAAVAAGHGDPATALPGTAGMPAHGALPVTVPGAVAGWWRLLEQHGTRTFAALARPAIRLARDGFEVSTHAAELAAPGQRTLAGQPGFAATHGRIRAGRRYVQPELADTLEALAAHGPAYLYGGALGARIAQVLADHGATMTVDDLAAHRVEEVDPLHGRYRDLEVLELPPPTQGVTALTTLGILDALGDRLPDDPVDAAHLQIEAVRLATADRWEHLTEPDRMPRSAASLLAPERLSALAATIDAQRTAGGPVGRPAPGGTAYLCAVDAEGRTVSCSQSNFRGFGSGVVVAGVGLHDRGAHFSLDPDDPGAIGPRRRPLHTLIPALALRDGHPALVLGTMGGDAQPQIQAQLLGHLVDRGRAPAAALSAPRFVVSVGDGAVALEPAADAGLRDGLRARGHDVRSLERSAMAGHAHLLAHGPAGWRGASDPRTESAVLGP